MFISFLMCWAFITRQIMYLSVHHLNTVLKIFAPKCFNWVVGGRGVTSHHPPYSIVDDYIFSCCRHEKLYCTEPESLQWWCKMKCWNLKWKILKISCSSRLTMYVHLCLSSSSTFWDCTFYVSTYVLTILYYKGGTNMY